jgi:hypothetical protein
MAASVIEESQKHHDWEEFSRMKLMEGGSLQRYYTLQEDSPAEYEEWRKKKSLGTTKPMDHPRRAANFLRISPASTQKAWNQISPDRAAQTEKGQPLCLARRTS